jgi:monoamine oxidase
MGTPVTRIVGWDQPVTEVHTAHGIHRARQVILALSPPLCQRITFSPELPHARQELQKRWPAHGPMVKTAMVYDKPFWFREGYNGQVAAVDGPVIWSFDNSPPDKKLGVINAFMRAAQMPGDHAAAERLVAQTYADTWKDDRYLKPLEFHLHDWAHEEYSLSCVSSIGPGFLTSGLMPALRQPVGSLLWSGTETAGLWNGYMDGAVRSGHKASLMALQRLATTRGA